MMQPAEAHIETLLRRYPALAPATPAVREAIETILAAFRRGNTLFCCGNGGSAADADHICGELLKGFLLRRELPAAEQKQFAENFGAEGSELAGKLQRGLRSVSLLSHPGFTSAFCNDVDPYLVYAQQLYALGRKGDVLLGISTGGGAVNVKFAEMTAKMMGIRSILLTGNRHGACEQYADIVIAVPDSETYRIQEFHLPVYHTICAAVEDAMFGGAEQ